MDVLGVNDWGENDQLNSFVVIRGKEGLHGIWGKCQVESTG